MPDEAASNIVASKRARMEILHWHRCGYLCSREVFSRWSISTTLRLNELATGPAVRQARRARVERDVPRAFLI